MGCFPISSPIPSHFKSKLADKVARLQDCNQLAINLRLTCNLANVKKKLNKQTYFFVLFSVSCGLLDKKAAS